MWRLGVLGVMLALTGCGSGTRYVVVPPSNGELARSLAQLHSVGLRVRVPSVRQPCGLDYVPVLTFVPRRGTRVVVGSTIAIRVGPLLIPSPAVPKRRPRWATVPDLVGLSYEDAARRLPRSIWPCLRISGFATGAATLVVEREKPGAGTRVPAYGVRVGRGWKPTSVEMFLAPAR